MDKREILKLILSGEVEPEKLPLLIKASQAAGNVLFGVKDYRHDEQILPSDLFTTNAGKFHDNPNAPMYTGAELDEFAALGVKIAVITFVDSGIRDQDGNIPTSAVDNLMENKPYG